MQVYVHDYDLKWKAWSQGISPYVSPMNHLPYASLIQAWMCGMFRNRYSVDQLFMKHVKVQFPNGSIACFMVHEPEKIRDDTLVLIVFPTMSSGMHSFEPLIRAALSRQHIVVTLNKRGHHCPLGINRFDIVGDDEEVAVLIHEIQTLYPQHPCMAFGFSAGSIMLSRYLGKNPKQRYIKRAFCMCGGYDEKMTQNMAPVVSKGLKHNMMGNIFKRQERLQSEPTLFIKNALNCLHNPTFTLMNLSLSLGEYVDEQTFLKDKTVLPYLTQISIPILILNSRDDPIFEWSDRYIEPLTNIPHGIVIVTDKGGHGAYFQSLQPYMKLSWAEELALNFFEQTTKSIQKSRGRRR